MDLIVIGLCNSTQKAFTITFLETIQSLLSLSYKLNASMNDFSSKRGSKDTPV